MISYFSGGLLGLVQGVTEFLPISSDGHLTLIESFVPGLQPDLSFNIFLHGATFLAVLIYFRRDVGYLFQGFIMSFVPLFRARSFRPMVNDEWMLSAWLILLASIPTALVGFLLKDVTEQFLMTRFYAAVGEVFTGVWILLSCLLMYHFRQHHTTRTNISAVQVICIGLMQGIAVLPGVSRSGSTIATGLMFGIEPRKMARFSFLMALPAVFGALLLELPNIIGNMRFDGVSLFSFLVAFVVGLASIHIFLKTITHAWFWLYGVYCLVLGAVVLIFFV